MEYAAFDLVADGSYSGNVFAGRIVEIPVFVPFAGEYGAGVAAPHRDDDIGGANDLIRPALGVFARNVDAAFAHRLDGGRVDLVSGFGAAGPGDRAVAGVLLEKAECHLGPSGIVDAKE